METLSINIDDCDDKNNTSSTTVLNKIIIKIVVAFWRWVIRDVIVLNVRVKKPPKSQQYLLAFVG
jgi:hypothetical protein